MTYKSPLGRSIRAFGLALVAALALAALTAGSASALSFSPAKGIFPAPFTSKGGYTEIRVNNEMPRSCSGASGSGKFLTATSGEARLTYTGCIYHSLGGSGGTPCTSPGQASGTIVTSNLTFKLVYLDAAKTKYGLLLTPPGGGPFTYPVFAEAECSGFGKETWKGELMGQITSPALGAAPSTVFSLSFGGPGSTQEFRFVEGAGPEHRLVHDTSWNGVNNNSMAIAQEQQATLSAAGQFLP